MKLFLGNLTFQASENDVADLMQELGFAPTAVSIITDRDTGQSRGFCFVTFETDDDGKRAMEVLDGRQFMGRALNCNEARPRENRGGGGGGGSRYGGQGARYSDGRSNQRGGTRREQDWT